MSEESILLSDRKIGELIMTFADEGSEKLALETSRAATINAVQYLEGECTEHVYESLELISGSDKHLIKVINNWSHRYDCPECREKYHQELDIP